MTPVIQRRLKSAERKQIMAVKVEVPIVVGETVQEVQEPGFTGAVNSRKDPRDPVVSQPRIETGWPFTRGREHLFQCGIELKEEFPQEAEVERVLRCSDWPRSSAPVASEELGGPSSDRRAKIHRDLAPRH